MTPLLEFQHVTKRFYAVAALSDVSFDVVAGEFHSLCGENGAGKSTLMKILSGVYSDYEGQLVWEDKPITLNGPRDAERHGISIIHQELNLVADLSAAANMFLGRELTTRWGGLDDAQMRSRATQLFAELGCSIDPATPVRRLRIGDQQLVEIAKALSLNSRLLIMDEPTSALTEVESVRLFQIIRKLRERGVTIVYISHKMDEVFAHSDRITVLRDGKKIRTLVCAETTPREVTQLMVGRDIDNALHRERRSAGDVVLAVRSLSLPWTGHSRGWRLRNVNFEVRAGEVLGFAGLMGAGRTELLECLYGANVEPIEGTIELMGRDVRFPHPADAVAGGVAMVTEDRKRLGIVPQMSVGQHVTLSSLGAAATGGLIRPARERTLQEESIAQLRIKTDGAAASIMSLSGGNQQKALLARALRTHPTLLLLDDPTRGIDVGAKAEIYRLLDELCGQGIAIIFTSSELPELMAVSDRIAALCEGRLTAIFERGNFSEQQLLEAATQVG